MTPRLARYATATALLALCAGVAVAQSSASRSGDGPGARGAVHEGNSASRSAARAAQGGPGAGGANRAGRSATRPSVIAARPSAIATGQPIAPGSQQTGALVPGDATLLSGEFYDVFTFRGRRGQAIDARLSSAAFDTYLMLRGPDGFQTFNDDDMAAGATDSRVLATLPGDGDYLLIATSFAPGESGAYVLSLNRPGEGAPTLAPVAELAFGRPVEGRLERGDRTLPGGARVDGYGFRGRAGQRVALDLAGAGDLALTLETPSGARERSGTRLESILAEDGFYQVWVVGGPTAIGSPYRLRLEEFGPGGGRARPIPPAPSPSAPPAPSGTGGGGRLAFGVPAGGTLAPGDATLRSGEFADAWTFQGRRGQQMTLQMRSSAFDPYLILGLPDGGQRDNDDASDTDRNAQLALTLPQDGTYTITATSFEPGERGAYSLSLTEGIAGRLPPGPAGTGGRGRVYGVFVGISDYPGVENDLPLTSEDAIRLHDSLRDAGVLARESVLLTDRQATVGAVRSALRRVSQAAGPDDVFLLFFSGHGTQVPDPRGDELDGQDETIEMVDGALTDDEVADSFAGTRARVSLLTLDSCFSGGFARDVVTRPGVMGLFSSEEDLTSATAEKFEAGGYLSVFLRTGLEGEADADGDRIVTAGEVSAYLRRRFAEEVVDVEATTSDLSQSNYQFLVVDRGAVKVDDPLVFLN